LSSFNHYKIPLHRKCPSLAWRFFYVELTCKNLQNTYRPYKSHVIKFLALNLIANQLKTKRKVLNYFIQLKYKHYCSCCGTSYILNTLQFCHFNCHSCKHTLDHGHVEPEPVVQVEQARVEDVTNLSS
jgi:ribosomal protein L37AE/L43A